MNKTIKLTDSCTMEIINNSNPEAMIRVEIFARGSEHDVKELFEMLRNTVVYSVCKEARISDVSEQRERL